MDLFKVQVSKFWGGSKVEMARLVFGLFLVRARVGLDILVGMKVVEMIRY